MSKSAKAADYGHVTPALIQNVEFVLSEAAKHRYSTSRVYLAHNQVFKKSETPETCTSCVVLRANNLKKWYSEYAMAQMNDGKDVKGNKLKDPAPADVPRETLTTLGDIYSAYLDIEIPEDERSAIENLLADNVSAKDAGGTMLADSEVQLLNNRLAELNGPAIEVQGTEVIVKAKNGDMYLVTYDSEASTLTYLDDSEEVKNMKPGTYTTDTGDSYAVQPGGKTTFKAGEESIL